MMDDEAKKGFKWKFYYLTIQLNAIILLVALAFLGFFLIPGQYKIPIACGLIVGAVVLSIFFRKKYRETKAWLDEVSEKDKEKEA
jgi:hypothetical protein